VILLDTNVVSAVMAPAPVASVLHWLDRQDTASLYLSTITIAEIAYGIRVLPAGRRRRELRERFEQFVARGFEQRVLAFDSAAALHYAEVMGHRKELGRPMSVPDGQIAAIARAHRFSVATRNVRDFDECGLDVLNPFEP
jgi:predicted nucleic acid-binding protein